MYTQALAFKVRRLHPCLLSDVRFDVDLPDDDEVQVRSYMVSGGLGVVSLLANSCFWVRRRRRRREFCLTEQSVLVRPSYIKHPS